MPELPEVETVKNGLNVLLKGRVIDSIKYDTPKSFLCSTEEVDQYLVGAGVIGVKRRAKLLLINLDNGYSLVIHLKMTGQLVYRGTTNFGAGHPSRSLVGQLPDKSTRVIFTFRDHSRLFFNDQRKFGWIKLERTSSLAERVYKKFGPEPLARDFTLADFKKRLLLRPHSGIKAVLLDQSIVSGIGNIYSDESLWVAKIHPLTKVDRLNDLKMSRLYKGMRVVLNEAIDQGGSTDRNYVDALGRKGGYLNFARVFRREGQSCPRCGSKIIKLKVASRGTHICARCQKLVA